MNLWKCWIESLYTIFAKPRASGTQGREQKTNVRLFFLLRRHSPPPSWQGKRRRGGERRRKENHIPYRKEKGGSKKERWEYEEVSDLLPGSNKERSWEVKGAFLSQFCCWGKNSRRFAGFVARILVLYSQNAYIVYSKERFSIFCTFIGCSYAAFFPLFLTRPKKGSRKREESKYAFDTRDPLFFSPFPPPPLSLSLVTSERLALAEGFDKTEQCSKIGSLHFAS